MTVIHLLLAIFAFVYANMEILEGDSPTEAVQCNLCVNRFNWTDCDELGKVRDCSEQLVTNTHNFLAQYNVNLNRSATVVDRQFRCFRLELEIDVSTVQVFIRGCTYDDSFFCDGWTENGAKATNCAVCSTEMCERNTTGDVVETASTTFLPFESSKTALEISSTTQSSTAQSSSTSQAQTTSTSQAQSSSTTHVDITSTTKSSSVTTDEPCIVDWSTTTSKAAEEGSSQQNDVTESIVQTSSEAQELPSVATEVPQHSASPNGEIITPAPMVLTTTETSGVEGTDAGIYTILSMLLLLGANIFIEKIKMI